MGKTARYLDKRRLEEGYLERWNKDFSLWQWQHSIRLSSTWKRLPSRLLDTHYEAPSKRNDMGLHVQKCSLEDSGPWWQCKCHLLHLRSAGAENAAVSSGHARHKKTLRACHYQCSAAVWQSAERQQWCWSCYDSNLWNISNMTELKGSTTREPAYKLDAAACRLHHDKSNFFTPSQSPHVLVVFGHLNPNRILHNTLTTPLSMKHTLVDMSLAEMKCLWSNGELL